MLKLSHAYFEFGHVAFCLELCVLEVALVQIIDGDVVKLQAEAEICNLYEVGKLYLPL